MKSAYSLLFLASLASLAHGATLVQTREFEFLPDGSQNLVFDKFDLTLGTLTSVTVSVVMNKTGGRFEVDNDSTNTGTISMNHNVVGNLSVVAGSVGLIRSDFTAIGGSGSLTASSSLTDQPIAATSGDATNTFNATGQSDHIVFIPSAAAASSSGTIASFATPTYAGPGTFILGVNAIQSVSVTGLGGLQQAFTVSGVSGEVTVTYNYDAIPEPGAAVLGGLGVLALMGRRRR
ncbi:MAG: PEP-CTERM sorting domain-containing protein [Alphaproteobacteria bacterium]|nr:MAG: PEP-CTERM sorting domain-containing protein [Alphaproteobacteria bacterium]